MYSRNSFGSFYPVDSSVHRLNPVVKLFNFIVAIVLMLLTDSIYINLFLFGLVLCMQLLSFVPFRYYFRTFWSLRYIYILIVFICAYFRLNITETVVYIIKLITLVEYLNILAYTTSPSESAYGIEKFLSFFNFLYLPITKFAFKINKMLRYVPLMLTVEYKTLKAEASRGIDYFHSNIFGRMNAVGTIYGNILALTKRKSRDMAFASELRLYNMKRYRTNYRTNRVGFYDIFYTAFHLVLIYAYLVQKGVITIQ